MANPFDQFDAASSGNPFDQFDGPKVAPKKIGKDANADFLRAEMQGADVFTRNLAAAGTAVTDLYERAKQLVGKGDEQAIEANRVMREEAPVGAIVGEMALTAGPFALAKGIKSAMAIGGAVGASRPVAGEQSLENIAKGTVKNVALDASLAGAGQKVAGVVGDYVNRRVAEMALKREQNAPRDAALSAGLDAGLVVPPASVDPSFKNVLRESVAGKIATAQTASNQNADVIDALARKSVGLAPEEPLTAEAMGQVSKGAYQRGYEPVARAGDMQTSPDYEAALDGIVRRYTDAAESFPGAGSPDLQKLVDSYKPQGDRWSPAAVRDDAAARAAAMASGREQSRIAALQEAGKLQTEAAQAQIRADNFVPVPGMPRVPGRYSQNTDRAREYAQAAGEVSGLVGVRAGEREALQGMVERLEAVGPLPRSSFNPGHALKATQILRDEADDAFRAGNGTLGKAKRAIAKEIENEVERGLVSMGRNGAGMLGEFREARKLIAKAHTLKGAIVEGAGTVNARKLAARKQAGKPLSDELETIAGFAANFPKAVQPRTEVAGPGISKLNSVASLILGGGGAALGGLPGVAAAAAPFVVPSLARRSALGGGAQNSLRDLYELGLPIRVVNHLADYLSMGAVSGRPAFTEDGVSEPRPR